MERRDFMTAIGAVAALGAIGSAQAHEMGHDHAAHGGHNHPPKYKALTETSAQCVSTGNACLRHCFGMLEMKDTSMVSCTMSVRDLIQACTALEALAAVNSPHTAILAKAVGEICTACGKECDKFADIAECKACGASCRACAEECRKIAS
ncbi:four-helix bundle copper-binding protein [Methylobacterium segetis]|uniref:four-helix bundle copper-binding protein n=1 Tax=Methylobacterium segetis TaxID=2488750 RepID=UPI001045BDFA|nr:four-helix bundle copper-binding protein [Methylobacterium segetis]